MKENVRIILDEDGKKIILLNDIRFRSRRKLNWDEVEECLKEYIGFCFEIEETSECIYIGSDFPDEFAHSLDTKKRKGANEKAKANLSSVVGSLIKIASNKKVYPDYGNKHGARAKLGWYRYDVRFGLPAYDDAGNLIHYNIFGARMLVRCDAQGDLYLYDFIRIKKETSRPPW